MGLTTVMDLNNGVLRRRDHRNSRAVFDRLVRSGVIVRVLPGTFVDASRLNSRRTRCAAALAASPGSLLWGEDAVAALTGSLDARPFGATDRVTLAHAHGRRAAGFVTWVRRDVPAAERRRVAGLRLPSAAYLAVEASARDGGALIERFLRSGHVRPDALAPILPLLAGSKGQQTRCRIVRTSRDNPWSGGERRLHALLRRHRITGWVANAEVVIGDRRCFPDVLFEAARLVVEFDGYGVHGRPDVFETDRQRQNLLVIGGYRVLRYTWKQLTGDPAGLIAQVRTLLGRQTASDSEGA